jgi:antitoxin VapB
MAFHIRDKATDSAVRRLARLKGKSLTDTVREAVEQEYAALSQTPPLVERLQSIQTAFALLKRPGRAPVDKDFFDDMSGHP